MLFLCVKSSNILLKHSKIRLKCASSNVLPQCASYVPPQCASRFDSNVLLQCASNVSPQCASNVPPQRDEARPQIYAGRKNKHGRPVEGPKLLFMVHIHTIFTEFTHFCREISLVAITRFGRHFLAKIWWEEAPKHFIGLGQ